MRLVRKKLTACTLPVVGLSFNDVSSSPHIGDPVNGRFVGYTLRHAMTDMPAVLMPDFWLTEAVLWFRLFENHFSYRKITNQSTSFTILTPYLTKEVAIQVPDVLIRPSVETLYDDLKNASLQRLQPPKAGSVTPVPI